MAAVMAQENTINVVDAGMNKSVSTILLNLLSALQLRTILPTIALLTASQVNAIETVQPLDSPLSLSKALSFADKSHPYLLLADAELALARSKQLEVDTDNDLDAYFELAPTAAIPSTNDHFMNDSYLRLSVTKTLYDFGYSEHKEDAAGEAVKSQELMVSEARNKYHLKIMHLFFDALLSDLHFAVLNEAMAVLYVKYDKLNDKHTLGMVSDVMVAEAENAYREVADNRKSVELEQFLSRQRLAIALNRPDDIPSDLTRPDLPQLERKIPELSELLDVALKNNLTLSALEHAMLADKAAVKATQQQYGPTFVAGLELNEYERKLPGRSSASVGVALRIPLASGSKSQAETARASAKLSTTMANYDIAKHTILQQLSELIRRLELLQYKRTTDIQRLDSTALTLEKNRASYEMEIQSTLGDAMSQYTRAEWLSAKNDFDIAMTWAKIDILTGKKLYQEQGE